MSRTRGTWRWEDDEWGQPQLLEGHVRIIGITGNNDLYVDRAERAKIAAAPELLDALESIIDIMAKGWSPDMIVGYVEERAKAAVARATDGE
jgi:hypothetical protein